MNERIGDLRDITAGQATNVELQAAVARAQAAKLDELITAIKASAATTERLENVAIGVAITDMLRPIYPGTERCPVA